MSADTILTVLHIQKPDYKTAIEKSRKALNFLDACWDMEEEVVDQGCCPFTLLIRYGVFFFIVILVTSSINYAVYSFQSLSQESLHDCTERSSSLKKTMSEIFSNSSVSSMPFSL